jgi:hypothetical protein
MFSCITVLWGILFLALPAAAQETDLEVDREAPTAEQDERLADLIERLEIGLSALEELGRHDAHEIVQRIANELREERARGLRKPPKEENEEIKTARRRLKVMRTAVDAFLEANRRDAAELVEHAMHARELAIEGRRDKKANRIRETAPNRGQLAELLEAASKLYKEWNMPDRAEALADLSEVYAKQWLRQKRAERGGPVTERGQERESAKGLDSLATRVEIIRYARDAFAEAGDKKNAKVLEGVIHYGELVLEGASDKKLNQAAKAVPSKGNLVEYMNWASRKYREWGRGERAGACRNLAGYYARQLRAEQQEEREEHEIEGKRDIEGNLEDLNHRIKILGFAHDALTRAGWETGAHTIERVLHGAELQRDGADNETLAKAFKGLSMDKIIELLKKASSFYNEWGWEGRAAACSRLAEYYDAREHNRTKKAQ